MTSEEESVLIHRYQHGDESAIAELLSLMRPLIRHWQKRHRHCQDLVGADDLRQVIVIAILRAVRVYDGRYRLSTLCKRFIFSEVNTAYRDALPVSVPHFYDDGMSHGVVSSLIWKIRRANPDATSETIEALVAARLRCTTERARNILQAVATCDHVDEIDKPSPRDGRTLGDTLHEEPSVDLHDTLEARELIARSDLSDRQTTLLSDWMRGIPGHVSGEREGVTKARIRQIVMTALYKIKTNVC
jgi:DNA-directed RNA polymerase specialized sigma subunit